jgi:hypothetical protein
MRSSIRRTTVVLLVTAFLIPGILAARTPATFSHRLDVSRPEGFFNTVWSLFSTFWSFDPVGRSKNGGALDPSGSGTSGGTTTTTTTTTCDGTGDNGGALDPSGHP